MSYLRFSLLGPFQVTLDAKPVTNFAYGKVRALLAYLVVEARHRHSREKLATMFWPESSPEAARVSLRKALSVLRKAINDQDSTHPYLIVKKETIQFNPASNYGLDLNELKEQLDATSSHAHHQLQACKTCIRNLEQVAHLYRGDFLQGMMVNSLRFEEWALTLREHLRIRVLTALHELTYHMLSLGKYSLAQEYALRQVEMEPYREEAHRALMQILAKSGQRSAALAQYETCRRILDKELGVEPSAETQKLYKSIRASGKVHPHNLPLPLSSLLGREAELLRIGEHLANPKCHLLTLAGPGGIGKTSLALQATQEHLGGFLHGAYIIYLASLHNASQVVTATINALPLTLSWQDEPKTQLLDYLREKSLLLIFDNFEHLLFTKGTTVNLLNEIMQVAPNIKILVTSRERLRLRAEWVLTIEGLSYPTTLENTPVEKLSGYAAMELFEQRAQQLVNDFSVSQECYLSVARICQILYGTPLGIELAAGWIDRYTCQTIANEIETNLDFLVTSLRDVPDRHHSIRAVFKHSWKLLSNQERSILHRLAVFQSPFRQGAAREVSGALPHHLATLANKSLLFTTVSGRYSMHPLIKQYLIETLEADPVVSEQTRRAHANYYAQFMQERETPLVVQHKLSLLDELDLEIGDITTTWDWAISQNDLDIVNSLLEGLYIYYWARNYFRDGQVAFEQAIDTIMTHDQKNQLLLGRIRSRLAEFLIWLGDIDKGHVLLQESISNFRNIQKKEDIASTLFRIGTAHYWQGHYSQAREAYTEAVKLARSIGAQHHLAHALTGLANVISDETADYDSASKLYKESLDIYEELGNAHGIAKNFINRGANAYKQGHYQQAEQLYQQSLSIYREVNYSYGISVAFNNLAGVNRKLGNLETAKKLVEESLAIKRETGNRSSILHSLLEIGMIRMEMEEYAEARSYFYEALQLTLDLQAPTVGLDVILGFAELFKKTGKAKRAADIVTFILIQDGAGQEIKEQAECLYVELETILAPTILKRSQSEAPKIDIDFVITDLLDEL